MGPNAENDLKQMQVLQMGKSLVESVHLAVKVLNSLKQGDVGLTMEVSRSNLD